MVAADLISQEVSCVRGKTLHGKQVIIQACFVKDDGTLFIIFDFIF